MEFGTTVWHNNKMVYTRKRTRRASWLIVVTFFVALLALLIPHRAWTFLTVVFATLWGMSFCWVWLIGRNLHAERRVRFQWVAVGDLLEEWFEIRNSAPLPLLWVALIDSSTVPGYDATGIISVGMEGATRWRQRAVCTRRGRFALGPWHLELSDPLGLFELRVEFPQSAEIVVHPPIHTDLPVNLPAGWGSGHTRRQQRALQALVNASGVRAYRPTDPLHHLHWPTTARTGELFVRQFEHDTAGDVWLLLDMNQEAQVGTGADGTEEHAVLLAASLVARALAQQRAVGLAAYSQDPHLIAPQRGQGQRWRLLQALALVEANSTGAVVSEPNGSGFTETLAHNLTDLRRIIQRGTALLVITPSDSVEWIPALVQLARIGTSVSVVLLDRASFGGSGNSMALKQELARIGINTSILRQGAIGSKTPTLEANNQWEYRMTPLGGVVVVRP